MVLAFFAIFIALAIYIKKVLPSVDSPVAKSFVVGFAVGVVGLALNATLIDVFEASKIAFLLWILMGITFGILVLYQRRPIDLGREFIKVATSPIAIVIYLVGLAVVVYTPMLGNFFVADDFTWFRWAADCSSSASGECSSVVKTISNYFTEAGGFFYRPGTKLYFDIMYSIFWLNQNVYHMVSLLLHVITASIFYFIAKRILKNNMLGAISALLFLVMSGYAEIVFWISATGHLFNALFILASLLFFMLWDEKKKSIFYLASIFAMVLSLLFYELGIVVPLLIIAYKVTQDRSFRLRDVFKGLTYPVLFVPSILYLIVRFAAGSHWQGGDYSYNLIKLPFNVAGNLIGYLGIVLIGPLSLSFYEKLRSVTRENP